MLHARLTCVLIAVVLSNISARAQADQTLSIDQLIEAGLERNRDFLAAKQRLTEAQGLLRQAGIRPAPTVEVEGTTGRPLGTVGEEAFTVGYFKPIETGGKRDKRVQVAQNSVDLAQAEIAERSRQLAFDIRTRYVDAAAELEKLRLLNRALETNQEYFRLTRARVDRGDAAPLEADLFATELSRSEAQQMMSSGRSESSLSDLKQTVGFSTTDLLMITADLDIPSINMSLAQLIERAKAARPDLRSSVILEAQGQAEVALAEAEGRPDLTLSARYSRIHSRFDALGLTPQGTTTPLRDLDNVLTFGVSIPFFTRKQNLGNIEAARSRLAAAQLRREHLENTVALEVESAFKRWTAATRALGILRTGVVNRSQQTLQVIRQAYNLGQLRMFDVLNEQRRALDTQLTFVDAQAEAAKAFAELERAAGGNLR
jgi:outer membrane protein, heavy metal efflux system